MTKRQTYIVGMILNAYRNICKITQEEFAKKSGISRAVVVRLESFANKPITKVNEVQVSNTTLNTLERIAMAMEIKFYQLLEVFERLELIKDDELDATIYLEVSKIILRK